VTEFGSTGEGTPALATPAAFGYVQGQTRLVPGLETVVATMRPGERRTVMVPAALGYGRGGHYAPDVPGEPRFVISPETLLVYEIEVLPGG
jgi:FKBP-type peptidyl-prolyl cis-trans isomerase